MSSHDRSQLHNDPTSGARLLSTSQTSGNGTALPQQSQTNGLRDGGARCKNKMLAALPRDAWERLQLHLRRVLLHQGDVLQESGAVVEHVHFIESGMISRVVDGSDGAQVEVGVTGREGLVGGSGVLGHRSLHLSVVQIAGNAYRLPVEVVQAEYRRGGVMQNLLHSHMHLVLAQSSQSAFCNRAHTLEERLSRWLLTVQDRIQSDELELTHEFISHMLGVRRSGVTVALGVLQQAGLIETARGLITIGDREKVKSCACECYEITRAQFQILEHQTSA